MRPNTKVTRQRLSMSRVKKFSIATYTIDAANRGLDNGAGNNNDVERGKRERDRMGDHKCDVIVAQEDVLDAGDQIALQGREQRRRRRRERDSVVGGIQQRLRGVVT